MPVYDNQGHWDSDVPMDPGKYFGFVYLITNLINNRKYIGKKQYVHGGKTYHKKADGRKQANYRKGVQTDWRTYTGSSKDLNADIEALGVDNFSFEVICEYKTKGMLHYAEVMLQNDVQVLAAKLPDGTREYYNRSTAAMKFLPPDEVSDETRRKLSKAHENRDISYLHTPEVRERAGKSCKGLQRSLGYKHTEETKLFLSTSQIGSLNHQAIGVMLTKEGELPRVFGSRSEAAKFLGVSSSYISNCARKYGKNKSGLAKGWLVTDLDNEDTR